MSGQNKPYAVEVKAGETKYFCKCGESKTMPHCDGAHESTGVEPMVETFDKDQTVYICGCFKSGTRPFCDGAHKNA
ncbi:MAG: CDGSH iron-sulfur domain-containing protein [SAR324 cluster bacterium]|nr:CDGSH iron-sulfur domain-containing protein [SAR324 cluster bacterium]